MARSRGQPRHVCCKSQPLMNTRISVLATVVLTLLISTACSTGGMKASSQFDDAVVATQVRNAIERDASLMGTSISVSVDRGVVTLRGSVRTPSQLERAGTIASQVEGVTAVRNELSAG